MSDHQKSIDVLQNRITELTFSNIDKDKVTLLIGAYKLSIIVLKNEIDK